VLGSCHLHRQHGAIHRELLLDPEHLLPTAWRVYSGSNIRKSKYWFGFVSKHFYFRKIDRLATIKYVFVHPFFLKITHFSGSHLFWHSRLSSSMCQQLSGGSLPGKRESTFNQLLTWHVSQECWITRLETAPSAQWQAISKKQSM
jgi:hypothetical protein